MKTALIFLLELLAIPATGLVSQPLVAEKDISFDCRIEPEPKLGEEFTVTISFTFNEKTYYDRQAGGKAVATIGTFWPQQYVSGDTMIEGYFDKGETYLLSATYRAVKSGVCYISGTVITHEVDAFGQPFWKSYTNTSLSCAEYYLKDDKPGGSEKAPDTNGGYDIFNPSDDDSTMLKPLLPGTAEPPAERTDSTCDTGHNIR